MTGKVLKSDLILSSRDFYSLYGRKKTVAAYTLGCKVNAYDTQAAIDILKNEGDFDIVPFDSKADVYIINTCTVTNLSDRKSRQMIHKAKKQNENALIICMGCYAQRNPETLINDLGIDIVLGNKNRKDILKYIYESADKGHINAVLNIDTDREFEDIDIKSYGDRSRAFIKIEEGCDQFCTYCIIPFARGRVRSRTIESILEQSKRLADEGYKEVVLTGINLSWYGKDTGEKLSDVILKINEIKGIERIRIGSIEPGIFSEEFLSDISKAQKLCDHFHISLQSGSDTVLDRMHRGYSSKDYKTEIDNIRKYFKYAGITTDVMTGFPGETEKEFEQTCQFVKEVGFSRLHVFPYSVREGTKAAKMEGQIAASIKKARASRLIEIGHELERDFTQKNLGLINNVLYEQINSDIIQGYSTNYIRVYSKGDKEDLYKVIPTKLTEIKDNICYGKIK